MNLIDKNILNKDSLGHIDPNFFNNFPGDNQSICEDILKQMNANYFPKGSYNQLQNSFIKL